MAVVDAVYTQPGSAGALDEYLVPPIDVSQFAWINLQIGTDSYSGTLTFLGTNDPTALTDPDSALWIAVDMYRLENLHGADSASQTSATNIMAGRPATFSYFAVKMTAYSSGTATGLLELRRDGLPGFALTSVATQLLASTSKIGFINNDGLNERAIAAGTTSDTVIVSDSGFLSHILVTTEGTNAMKFYDNGSAGTGTIIAIVPANTPAGEIIWCKATGEFGVTADGHASNPAVTCFYTNI